MCHYEIPRGDILLKPALPAPGNHQETRPPYFPSSSSVMPFRSWLLCAVFLLPLDRARAGELKDPLRFVPMSADIVVKIKRPRDLLQGIEKHELFAEAKTLAAVRELVDSTNLRRLE